MPKCSNICQKGIFVTYVSQVLGLSVQMCVGKEYLSLYLNGTGTKCSNVRQKAIFVTFVSRLLGPSVQM